MKADIHPDYPVCTITCACGNAVKTRTTLLVARFRYHIRHGRGHAQTLLCEEVVPLAFTGSGESLAWLDSLPFPPSGCFPPPGPAG